LLDDATLCAQARADLVRRYPRPSQHGRQSTPVEALLRLVVVKRRDNGSDEETEERVADSLVLRWVSRVSCQRAPDDTTLMRWATTRQPATLHTLTDRVVQVAQQARVTQGRTVRLDGTVAQTPIHHPTDSRLLVDRVRGRSRLIRRGKPTAGDTLAGRRAACRTRWRARRQALQRMHRTVRQTGEEAAGQRRVVYETRVATAQQAVRQAERVRQARTEAGASAPRRVARVRESVDQVLPRVSQVIHHARARVLEGQKAPADATIRSLFEPHTRVIPRVKGGAAVEVGRTVVCDAGEGGIVSRFDVWADGVTERDELGSALTHHPAVCGHPPRLVTGDRGLHRPDNARLARAAGVRHLVIPSGGHVSPRQRAREKDRTWRRP